MPANPYASPTLAANATDEVPGKTPHERLFQLCARTSFGRVWPSCRHSLYPDRLEMKFLTKTFELPVKKICQLRSGGKGGSRHLEIVHDDPNVPETLHILPLFPGEWYAAFESLDIPTEDQVGLRESKQYHLRSNEWMANAEGLFWMFVLIICPAAIAAFMAIKEFLQSL